VGDRHWGSTVIDALFVVVSEVISEWIAKGEVVDRYYNPADRFAEVHLLLTNDDSPDPHAVQRLVGCARGVVHNLPISRRLLVGSLGWEPRLLRRWAAPAVELAHSVRPRLVRCHGANVNGLCALELRRRLGLPVVVSLHTLPSDPAYPPTPTGLWPWAEAWAARRLGMRVLREADLVLAVYESLVPYLKAIGARQVEVVYNALNGDALRTKDSYALGAQVRVISVGRQIPGKDPSSLIRAVAALPRVELTLVGDGALHDRLLKLARELELGDRVVFNRVVPNDYLVASLADYDVFAAHNDYLGVPKAVLEPMLAGLPILLNRGAHAGVPELNSDVCLLVDDSVGGYYKGLQSLTVDAELRERLGRNARTWAERACIPSLVEQRVVALYDELIERSAPAS
jgi:glycosyltransferase involved in cell wall biosynthesis